MGYKLEAKYEPSGDQITAIKELKENMQNGVSEQILLGATGTGKTFTMANIIADIDKPILIMAPNKTLATQLYYEMKEYFPNENVEYYVSNFDYYRPEAYVVSSDTYVEKDSKQNSDLDHLRHSTTHSLMINRKTIVVASVSCIYGIGDPETYKNEMISLKIGEDYGRDNLISRLVVGQYERNNLEFGPGTFRVRGDVIDVYPVYEDEIAYKVEFFGDEVEKISSFDPLTGNKKNSYDYIGLFGASHYATNEEEIKKIVERIEFDLAKRLKEFENENKLVEYQRLEMRVNQDIEMLRELGSCPGIENYTMYLNHKNPGETGYTLIDYFGDDFLTILDESHLAIPQLNGMYEGDRSRKLNLVDYGFRLPSALENRPLKFEEWQNKVKDIIFVSATPGDYELSRNLPVAQQIIRPTGLLDPNVSVRKSEGQIDDLISEIRKTISNGERAMVTTLTKRMSEDLTKYLKEQGIKVSYLHSEIKTIQRTQIINDVRRGKYDVLVGINLLREGLDIPEVSFIGILDADKEGFLRNARSLIQIIGRAARNSNGHVVMYADKLTPSMSQAIQETQRRRIIQKAYNEEHDIVPKTIIKEVKGELIATIDELAEMEGMGNKAMSAKAKGKLIKDVERKMKKAAKDLDFENAANYRDLLLELKGD